MKSSNSSSSTTTKEQTHYVRDFFLWFSARHLILLILLGVIVYFAWKPNNTRDLMFVDEINNGDIVYVTQPADVTLQSDKPFTVSTYDLQQKTTTAEAELHSVDNKYWLFDFHIEKFAMKVITSTAPIEVSRVKGGDNMTVESTEYKYHALNRYIAVMLGLMLVGVWFLFFNMITNW